MTTKPTNVASVSVIRGTPENGNPFRAFDRMRRLSAVEREELTAYDVDNMQGVAVMGPERILALKAFRDTGRADGYTFWDTSLGTPSADGREITDPARIDWEHCSLDKYNEQGLRTD